MSYAFASHARAAWSGDYINRKLIGKYDCIRSNSMEVILMSTCFRFSRFSVAISLVAALAVA